MTIKRAQGKKHRVWLVLLVIIPLLVTFSYLLFRVIKIPFSASGFETLADCKTYARMIDEFPQPDNDNWLNPNFTSFHVKGVLDPVWRNVRALCSLLGVIKPPIWSAELYCNLLRQLVKDRELRSWTGNYVVKFTPSSGANVIVWGDLQGAYHSFVRTLNYLHQKGIIDNNFRIIKPNHYFVFNGDLIDRSPFILETLTLTMRLLERNPTRVFYIQGNHEAKEHWHNYGLKRELEVRVRHLSNEKIPFGRLTSRFFKTLPLALYLQTQTDQQVEFVRISHYGRGKGILNEEHFGGFLEEADEGKLVFIKLINKNPPKQPLEIRAIIKGQSRSTTYQETDGLDLLAPDKGSTAWTSISCPTSAYQNLFNYYNDAFTMLLVNKSIGQWTLALYKQDIREQIGFVINAFNLVSGQNVTVRYLESLHKDTQQGKEREK